MAILTEYNNEMTEIFYNYFASVYQNDNTDAEYVVHI